MNVSKTRPKDILSQTLLHTRSLKILCQIDFLHVVSMLLLRVSLNRIALNELRASVLIKGSSYEPLMRPSTPSLSILLILFLNISL